MSWSTADLCDAHSDEIQISLPIWRSFGGLRSFHGPISTIKSVEDNSLVRKALDEPGRGRVLVIDGGGSLRCAMLGDQLAELASVRGWSGVVVHGAIRDSRVIHTLMVGVQALATHPLKSVKAGRGERDVTVQFAGVTFTPGQYLYADEDGLIVSPHPLVDE